jgi:hypothetical protein
VAEPFDHDEVGFLARTMFKMSRHSHLPKEALQALFARASVRRAERRVLLQTLREIVRRRFKAEPLLLPIPDRRVSPRR